MSFISKFEQEISSILGRQEGATIAVAVSGGSDSLALCLLSSNYFNKQGGKVIALTIDHGLRPESSIEANNLNKLFTKLQISHYILKWKGEKPKSNIQEKARLARYKLLTDFCHQHNIQFLLTAHHEDDQAENFIIRAERGAGIYGLAGITKIIEINKIKIVRPLLNFNKKDLQEYLREKKIQWVEDPSNLNPRFARVRARMFLAKNPQWTKKIASISNNLAKTKEAIEFYLNKAITDLVHFSENKALFAFKEFNALPQEIRFRMLEKLLQKIGNKDKPPRSERIEGLLIKLYSPDVFKASTLANCLIYKHKNECIIKPEYA